MFTAAITPAIQVAGATIARATPQVLRFAGFTGMVAVSSYAGYVFNKEVVDPFVERQTTKLSRWLDRRTARVAARRWARYTFEEAEIARRVAAEVERRMQDIPAATRRRAAAQAQTMEGEVVDTTAPASAADMPMVNAASVPA
jgi:hypothetical protein